ncbi:MAG: sigma-E processing peptidase SpoIIGA [Clostridia bacterium]|nr:sigma-E processing peptidase SpoIIGA [Clostridia bacterium]
MTVYIEYVLINNFIIDFFLLKTTFLLGGKKVKIYRLILASIFGSVVALIYPLINLSAFLTAIFKLSIGIMLLILSASYKDKKEFVACFLFFLTLSALLGGGIFMAYSFFGVEEIKEFEVAFCCIPAYFITAFIKKIAMIFYKKADVERFTFEVEIFYNEKKVKGRAFLDTGNNVYYKNTPAVICSKRFFSSLKLKIEDYRKLEKIKIDTINGQTENYCILLDKLKILNGQTENIIDNVWMVITDKSILGVDLILHPRQMQIKGGEENEIIRRTKKIS